MRIALALAGGCYIAVPLALLPYIGNIHCSEAMQWFDRDGSFLLPVSYPTDMVVGKSVAWLRVESPWASDQSCHCREQGLQGMAGPAYTERALGSCCFG